jgi:two-component system NtrC family sensor kinase
VDARPLERGGRQGQPELQGIRGRVQKIEFHVRRAKDVTHRLWASPGAWTRFATTSNVNLLLDQTRSFLENEASFRNIEVVTDYDKTLPCITSDASQLQQVFLNILDNAIDAIDKDGVITVTTRHNAAARAVIITISDTGKGCPGTWRTRSSIPSSPPRRSGRARAWG